MALIMCEWQFSCLKAALHATNHRVSVIGSLQVANHEEIRSGRLDNLPKKKIQEK